MLTHTSNVWNKDLIHVSDAFVGKIVDNLLKNYLPDSEPTMRRAWAGGGAA